MSEKLVVSQAWSCHNSYRIYGNLSVGVRYGGDRWNQQQYLQISFDQLLLPYDILYVYRTIAGVDGINWMHDSRRGTYLRGIRYESKVSR